MQKYPCYSVVDIEVAPIPNEEALKFAPEFKAPSNYVDPKKIAAAIEEARTAWLEGNALRPLTGRVCAIGWQEEDDGKNCIAMAEPHSGSPGESESGMISLLWSYLFKSDESRVFLTFFGNRFDWPFLIRRSWDLGLDMPGWVMDNRGFLSPRFIDLAKIWSCGDPKETISLDRLARYLRVGQKNGEGKDFAELLKSDLQKAEEYLRNDLELTRRIAIKMGVARISVE